MRKIFAINGVAIIKDGIWMICSDYSLDDVVAQSRCIDEPQNIVQDHPIDKSL